MFLCLSAQSKQNQGQQQMQGPNQGQPGPNPQVQAQQGQPQQGPNNQGGLTPDPINALQNLASQGSRNQMMTMGPQGQMQQQGVMGPNPGMGGMQGQMGQQGPIVSQGPQAQTATSLLQTLNRPQMNMQLQNKLSGPMGMVSNQGQMGNNMVGGMGGMGNPMGSQLQNQLAGGMQGQMMPNMSMPNSMQVPMSGSNTMGQMPCNQVGMGGQMAPNNMQGQMQGQMGKLTCKIIDNYVDFVCSSLITTEVAKATFNPLIDSSVQLNTIFQRGNIVYAFSFKHVF